MMKREAVLNYMKDNGLDAALITSMENMQWYSGFKGDTGWILVTPEKEYFITDARYFEMAEHQLAGKGFELIKMRTGNAMPEMKGWVGKENAILGIEFDTTSVSQKVMYDNGWGFILKPIDDVLHELRSVKTEEDIVIMKEGCKITEAIFYHMCEVIKPGVSEFDLLAEMHYMMNKNGCHPSFAPIIASGENSSSPHAVVSDRKVRNGDFVTMDFGVIYKGLCTDFTRTVAVGGVEEELSIIYNIVRKANEETEKNAREGMKASEVDSIARQIIKDAGYGDFYEHGTGHGVGVEIHEAPWVSTKSENILKKGNVFTVEPGIYLPGKGGVRIEDMGVMTENGYENFYQVTKEMIVL